MKSGYRVGLGVPSSNTTIETEVPEVVRRKAGRSTDALSFHSSRARLHSVNEESLRRMVGEADRCVEELADADVDLIAHACLICNCCTGDPRCMRKPKGAWRKWRARAVALSR